MTYSVLIQPAKHDYRKILLEASTYAEAVERIAAENYAGQDAKVRGEVQEQVHKLYFQIALYTLPNAVAIIRQYMLQDHLPINLDRLADIRTTVQNDLNYATLAKFADAIPYLNKLLFNKT